MFVDDIIFLFVEAGLGTAGVDLFIGPRPVIATACLSVIATGSAGPMGTHNMTDVPAYVRPSAQIVSRATTLAASEAKIQLAYNALYKVRNRFVNGTWYMHITIPGEPFPLGEDDNNLMRFVFNINSVKRLSSVTS